MLEPDFLQSSFPHRFIYFNLVGIIARMRFHAFWYMVESSYIASGMGYDPIAGNYDASANVRIMSTELAPSFKIFFDNWNMGTNKWLRECIYKRFTKAGERPGLVAVRLSSLTFEFTCFDFDFSLIRFRSRSSLVHYGMV